MDNKTIGQKIASHRKGARLTQKQLGEIIGKTESSVQKYESGSTEIPLSTLYLIADALDCKIYDFLELENEAFWYESKLNGIIDNLIEALEYNMDFENETVSHNGYVYNIPAIELLDITNDIRFNTQDLLDDLLKKYRSTRTRIC